MKKYTLFLFVFALFIILLGFNTKSASASNCASGDLFNTATGQPCTSSNTTSIVPCPMGDVYSSITGERCNTWTEDNTTLNTLFKRELVVGSKGEDVKAIQQILKDAGFLFGKVDGSYGPITKSAVMKYQIANSISSTGVVDSNTLVKIKLIPWYKMCPLINSTYGVSYPCPPVPTPTTSTSKLTTVVSGVLCRPDGKEYSSTVSCPTNMALVNCGVDETTGKSITHTDSAFYDNANSGQASTYWVSRAKDGSNSCQIRIKTNSEGLCATTGTYWNVRAFCTPIFKTPNVTVASQEVTCSADSQDHTGTVNCPANTTLLDCGVDETTGQSWTHTDAATYTDAGHGSSFYWVSRAKDGSNSCQFRIKTDQTAYCASSSPWVVRAFCAPVATTVTTSASTVTCSPDSQPYTTTVNCPANTTLVNCGIDETTGQPWTHTDTMIYADAGTTRSDMWVSRAKDGSNSCQFDIKTNNAGHCSVPWSLRAFCMPNTVSVSSGQNNNSFSQLANNFLGTKSLFPKLLNLFPIKLI